MVEVVEEEDEPQQTDDADVDDTVEQDRHENHAALTEDNFELREPLVEVQLYM